MENDFKEYRFIKAIDKKHFDCFINNGQIYMNSTEFFRELGEKDKNIGDLGEAAILSCGKDITISIADPIEDYASEEELKEKMDKLNWSTPFTGENLRMFDGKDANVLSLYAISISESNDNEHKHIVPKQYIDEFSNHRFVLIINPMVFIARIKDTLSKLGKCMEGKRVIYYPLDSVLRNNLSIFHKQDHYSYQNEYRYVVSEGSSEPLIINIGSLNDICIEIDLNNHGYLYQSGNINLSIIKEGKCKIEEK